MQWNIREQLAFGVSALGIMLAMPALAQDTGDRASESMSAGDIVVTARRMEERLQDVPISITVFNQEQLNNFNVVSGTDLATFTPSLSANARYGSENTSFAIRGFTQEQRTAPSVAVYFADVVAPRGGSGGGINTGDGAGPGSFFDLQNVQVLKGPQGTLFGRNTTGGAILLVPQKPKQHFEGYVEGSYGNLNMRRLQGVVNVPLGEDAALRIGTDWNKREGYLKNISGIGPEDFADIDYITARASLIVNLTPDLENYTIASYTLSENNGTMPRMGECFPAARSPRGTLSCQMLGRLDAAGKYAVENPLANAVSRMEQWQVINTTTWQVSASLTIKNIASYAQLSNVNRNDIFGASWRIPEGTLDGIATGSLAGMTVAFSNLNPLAGGKTGDQSTFTEELQFQGNAAGGRLVWQAGGYLEISEPLSYRYGLQNPSSIACTDLDTFKCVDVLGILAGTVGRVGGISYNVGQNSFRNLGVYAQATYDLTQDLKFTGGLRYTSDRSESAVEKVLYRFPAENVPVGYCVNSQIRNPNLAITGTSDCHESFRQTTSAPTWLIGLDYKPADEVLLYAKYSRGYRQGSTNPFSAPGYNTFGAEKVDTYEAGGKTSWRGAVPGKLNISAFYNHFTGQQLQASFRGATVAPTIGIVNAGQSRIYGVEVEAGISPFPDLSLDANYTYLNTLLKAVEPVGAVPPWDDIQGPVAGSDLPFAPRHKLVLSAHYRLPLPASAGEVRIGATYSYSSSYLVNYSSTRRVEPLELMNANLSWRSVGGSPVDLSLFANNLFDKYYYSNINDQVTSGFFTFQIGEPRTYGIRLRYRFGD